MNDDNTLVSTVTESVENKTTGIDVIEETGIQEFPEMLESEQKQEEPKKDEKVIISEEECGDFYGCLLEAGHGMVASGKGKSHRDIPEARRKAQGKVLHRLIEKYNIAIPAEFDIIIMGASVVADWQYKGSGPAELEEEVPEKGASIELEVEKVDPELGGVISTDSKAIEENNKIEVE